MSELIRQLQFKGTWRNYQERVLNNLTPYFSDKKLNIVAAPGAGKTVLGIEVFRRLGNPVLIFSPTITIKKQWKTRILESFLPADFDHNLISTDINKIKEITSITYQKLHSAYRKEQQEELIAELKKVGVKTLVLDEAHHLRSDWYKSLQQLIDELSDNGADPNFKIISLTATPPYDVEEKEWNNYYELCGPVDEEISVPELVQTKDLCPHQDLLYFSSLDKDEKILADKFNESRKNFLKYLKTTAEVKDILLNSPFIRFFKADDDHIYDDIDFTVAIISYLFSFNQKDKKAKEILQYIQIDKDRIPEFDYETAQNLINGMLGRFKEFFENTNCIREELKDTNLLKSPTKVDLTGSADLKKIYARSKNKLNSIVEITKAEYENLGKNLREVILLDNIGENSADKKLTVMSAFGKLNEGKQDVEKRLLNDWHNKYTNTIFSESCNKQDYKNKKAKAEDACHKWYSLRKFNIAVLTGSLVIIPKSAKYELDKILETRQIQVGSMSFVDYDEDYLKVESHGDINTVEIISELFEMGQINVLIGTQALLGEGWDSPCLNTLILGSVVGSFMLSNQMRGRAIRVDKSKIDKTADIWHLIGLENVTGYGYDYEIISKRFDTFDGINYQRNTIESGIDRLGEHKMLLLNVNNLNKISLDRAKNRSRLIVKWEKCLYNNANPLEANMHNKLKIQDEDKNCVLFKHIFNIKRLAFFAYDINKTDLESIKMLAFVMLSMGFIFNAPSSGFIPLLGNIFPIGIMIISLIIVQFIFKTPVVLFKVLNHFNVNTIIIKSFIKTIEKYKLYGVDSSKTDIMLHNGNIIITSENRCNSVNLYQSIEKLFAPTKKCHYILKFTEQKDKVIYIPPEVDTIDKAQYFAKELEKSFGEIEIIDLENPNLSSSQKRQLLKSRYNDFLSAKVKKQRKWG